MKTLLLAGAVLAAVGCQTDSAPVQVPKTSTGPDHPSRFGPVDPTADLPETTTTTDERMIESFEHPLETTATTEPAEPVLCEGYSHPLHHLPCDEAAAQVASQRAAREAYEPISPQSQSVGRGAEPAGGDTWATLAECESGSANVDTGNGYSGFFQFSDATWQSMGTGYSRAVDAPYSVQLDAAQRLQARSGWDQWPACTSQMGLR